MRLMSALPQRVAAKMLLGVSTAALSFVAPALGIGPEVIERTLPNGATLLVSEQHALPIVLVTAVLDAGSRRDPEDAFGLASLTADTLTEGTSTRSSNEIAAAIEFIGGGLSAGAGVDFATVSVKVLRKDLDIGLELFAETLLDPVFPEVELARAKESTLASLRSAEDDPTDVAGKAFSRALYGGHPYAHPVEGEPESVARIGRADLVRFYEKNYGPQRAAIVVVGDVEVDDVERRLVEALASWRRREQGPLEPASPPPDELRLIEIDRPVTQASIVMGHRGVARSDPDFEAIRVMNYVLGGGGFSSRLMEKIRNQAGLVYSVSSYFSGGELPGSFRIILQTKNASVPQAIELARAEVQRMRDGGVTEDELRDAKTYLTGSFPLSLDSNGEIASFIASSWFLGLGLDAAEKHLEQVEAVTLDDVSRVAAARLRPQQLLEVVVADLAKAGEAGEARRGADRGGPGPVSRLGLIRASLWGSFVFNLVAAYIFAVPGSYAGRLLGLPAATAPIYLALTSYMIAVFGCSYGWLAMQRDPYQPLLCVGAIGKFGVFVIAAGLWLNDAASLALVALASGDLALALLWFWALLVAPLAKSR